MAFARVNGVVLHHRVFGPPEAPALVFANSLGTDFRIWQEVAPAFGERFRVVLYDKRGHGLSDAPPAPYAMDDHADDLLSLLDSLGISRAAIVGVSVGGMIAQRVAIRAPERVAALVLCDTAARIGAPATWNERIVAIEAGGIESIADRIMERWFAPGFRTKQAADYAGWRNMLVRTPASGYVGTCAAIRDADLTADAPHIAAPALCVAGEQDGSTPPDLVEATARLIPGARFAIVPGAGHLPSIEKPGRLTALIERFLKEAGLV